MYRKNTLTPNRLTKKEVAAQKERNRQAAFNLQNAAAIAKAREAAETKAREEYIANAETEAAFEAKSARRKELLEAASKRRAATLANWHANYDADDLPPEELGIDAGTAKPLDNLLRSRR